MQHLLAACVTSACHLADLRLLNFFAASTMSSSPPRFPRQCGLLAFCLLWGRIRNFTITNTRHHTTLYQRRPAAVAVSPVPVGRYHVACSRYFIFVLVLVLALVRVAATTTTAFYFNVVIIILMLLTPPIRICPGAPSVALALVIRILQVPALAHTTFYPCNKSSYGRRSFVTTTIIMFTTVIRLVVRTC